MKAALTVHALKATVLIVVVLPEELINGPDDKVALHI
jgi:uncharacterized membrane protein